MSRLLKNTKARLDHLIIGKWPLVALEYLLTGVGVIVFVLKRSELLGFFRNLAYVTFGVWNATYWLVWRDWERHQMKMHAKIRPKTLEEHSAVIELVHNFINSGIIAVSILLPASLAIIGFQLAGKRPVGGFVETSFWLTVSLAVALWNLSRLPTKVHFPEIEAERTNLAYDFWTAFLEMFQLSSLLLGLILLLAELSRV